MYVYMNAELSGFNSDASLISLGCVAETGEKLYIEFMDVPKYLMIPEVAEYVLPDTYIYSMSMDEGLELGNKAAEDHGYKYYVLCKGHAAAVLTAWFKSLLKDDHKGERIQLVSYLCHYDVVHFFNLFQGQFPYKLLVPYCYDLFNDAITDMDHSEGKFSLQNRIENALKCNFEEYAQNYYKVDIPDYDKKHALYLAEIIKNVWTSIYVI